LQRRLPGEDLSFQQLLDDTRRELAVPYLGRQTVTFAQATHMQFELRRALIERVGERAFESARAAGHRVRRDGARARARADGTRTEPLTLVRS
jgi:hypothetical protein